MSKTTTPHMILANKDGKPIKGVTKSTSLAEAQEKAEKLGPGTYKVIRPDATIVVTWDVAPTPEPEPEPEPVGLQSRTLNMSRVLQFRDFNMQGRYTRWVPNLHWAGVVSKIEFMVYDYTGSSSTTLPFEAAEYRLTCDGVVVSTKAVSGKASFFENVDFSAVGDGWRLFEIVPKTPTTETCHPLWVYVGTIAPQSFAPIQTGSYSITHEQFGLAQWGKAPVQITPNDYTLEPRTAVPFSTALSASKLYRRNLSPTTNGDIPYLRTLADGRKTCMNMHGYAFSTIGAKEPGLVLRDGPFGVGTLPGPTHLHIGRRGGVYFCDPWSVGHLKPDGSIQRLAGWHDKGNGLELAGDWSAVPQDRRFFHELWGFAWWQHTVDESTLDTTRELDRGDGTLEHPHTLPPTMYVADSQNNRIVRLRFSLDDHAAPCVVDEFITDMADPWDVVEADDALYVSERKANRISAWDASTGDFIRVVVEGAAGYAAVNDHHRVDRLRPLADIRTQPCCAPEGLFIQDGWLYFGSIAAAQVKRINIASEVLELACEWTPVSKSEYAKIAVSDGTFGPRGSVFVSGWEVNKLGAPWAFLPDGTSWGIVVLGSHRLNSGGGGEWAGIGYSTSCAVGNGRLIYGGADYGLVEITQTQPGDITLNETTYDAGLKEYQSKGYRLQYGIDGFGQWGDPLPWGESPEMDYYLSANGHSA